MAAVCGKEETIMANTNTKTAPRGTKIKESFGSRLFDVVDVLIICVLLACVLIPLIHIVAASFSNPSLFVGHKGILLWPEGFSLASYQAVLKNAFLWTGYANTLFIVIVGTVLNVLLSMVAAYCLSRKHVAAGPTIMKLLVFTMYFSGGMIPLYLVVKGVGLYGSRWALILPTLVDTYNLIIMRTAFAGVPDSLEESAKLDGANAWTILWRIMAPLVKPTVAVITLYYAVSHWNSWFNAMLFLRDKTQYPLQLILRQILIQNDTADMTAGADYLISETIQYATVVVATLPILCIYPFVQKYFVKGVMIGAIKG